MKPIELFFALLALCVGVLLPSAASAQQACTSTNCGVTQSGQVCPVVDCRGQAFTGQPPPPVCSNYDEPVMCPIVQVPSPAGQPSIPISNGVIANICDLPNTSELTTACTAAGAQGDGLLGSPCGIELSPTCTAVPGVPGAKVPPILVACPAPLMPICYDGSSCNPNAFAGCKAGLSCKGPQRNISNDGWTWAGNCAATGTHSTNPVPIPMSANMGLFGLLAVLGVAMTGSRRRDRRRRADPH